MPQDTTAPQIPSVSTGWDFLDGALNAAIQWNVYEDMQESLRRQWETVGSVEQEQQTGAEPTDPRYFLTESGRPTDAVIVLGALAVAAVMIWAVR